ncbi:MAG: winged helix-turn-helix transcriptional regulator [Thermoleophilia bacterium]|nr:winged helix-turn-helix transcriptional regulator [Thermoleophilia bacterium]
MNRKLYEMHAEICKVLTNPKRIEILNLLRDGERSVSELAALAELPQTNVSRHLAFLRQKGMVASRREGSNIFYSVSNTKIFRAMDTMKEVLVERLREDQEFVAGLTAAGAEGSGRKL